jgi:hypothetical protein
VDTFLAEAYLSGTGYGLGSSMSRARAAAREMRREGVSIRFLRSFFLPEDELWFGLFEATSHQEVAELSRRAELVVSRIQRAVMGDGSRPTRQVCR